MRHHYVPEFLLKPWADGTPDGKVEVFRLDLASLPSKRHTPKHTGFDENLYSLSKPIVAGMEQHAVETNFLRHVDNLAALVRRKLDEQGLKSLSMTERVDWVRFLMSLRVRQPDVVDLLKRESECQMRTSLAAAPEEYEAVASDGSPPTLTEWTDQRFPGLIENIGLSFFHGIVDNPEIGNKILHMKWWLWDFCDVDHGLILADHPCIFTTGIDHPNLIVALPISPSKAFIATQNQSQHVADVLRQINPKVLLARLNESSVGQAKIRIYSRGRSPERFIRNRLAKRAATSRTK